MILRMNVDRTVIAQKLGVDVRTVHRLITRALEQLARQKGPR